MFFWPSSSLRSASKALLPRGTDGSNPSLSASESANHRSLSRRMVNRSPLPCRIWGGNQIMVLGPRGENVPFGRGIDAQRRACEPSFAEFAQFREGRVEPELGPPTAPRMADPTATSDRPTAGEMPGMVSEVDTEPRLFDFVPREAPPTSAPSRRASAERPHIGSVVYLLLVGLVAAATIGVFFGIAFFLLAQPKDKTFAGAGPVSPGVEQAVSTVKGTTRAGDAPATIIASAPTAPTPGPASG